MIESALTLIIAVVGGGACAGGASMISFNLLVGFLMGLLCLSEYSEENDPR